MPETITDPCPSCPFDDGSHICMENELRCVYCGIQLAPYNCNGCGKFVTTETLNALEVRCGDCL